MTITAFTLGSFGDVMPFIELGQEMIARGYDYRVATYEKYREQVEGKGVTFLKISGDADEMVSVLLGNSGNKASEGMNGIQFLLSKYPKMYRDFYNACKDSDLVIYMQFGSPVYHFAEKFGIPAIRSYAFPFDLTRKYCSLTQSMTRDSFVCYVKNYMCRFFMANAAFGIMMDWRRRLGLKRVSRFHDYTKLNGKKILTLYQYDEILAPPDDKWSNHVKLTGNWIKLSESKMQKGSDGVESNEIQSIQDAPLYIGFGSMNYDKMDSLYERILAIVFAYTKKNVILPQSCKRLIEEKFKEEKHRITLIGFVPFEQLFKQVCAVIHHGGNGTTHAALRSGKPQLIMAFGADQIFWGGQCYYLGIGPKPVNVKAEIDEDALRQKILLLIGKKGYRKKSEVLKQYISSDGVIKAADIIQSQYPQGKEK